MAIQLLIILCEIRIDPFFYSSECLLWIDPRPLVAANIRNWCTSVVDPFKTFMVKAFRESMSLPVDYLTHINSL